MMRPVYRMEENKGNLQGAQGQLVDMETARQMAMDAAQYAISTDRKLRDDEDGSELIDNKLVKQMQNITGLFSTLKEVSNNPLQSAIEKKVGDMAASMVENVFGVNSKKKSDDFVDNLLNSNFAFGLGQGIGQRSPELVESLGRTFGKDRAGKMIDKAMDGGGGFNSSILGSKVGMDGTTGTSSNNPGNPRHDPNIEMLMSLDPNNPEHIAAYAESQGGLGIGIARKMLMIHQDEIISRMKPQGVYMDAANMGEQPVQGQQIPMQEPLQSYNSGQGNPEQGMDYDHDSKALTNQINEMKNTIFQLENELSRAKSGKGETVEEAKVDNVGIEDADIITQDVDIGTQGVNINTGIDNNVDSRWEDGDENGKVNQPDENNKAGEKDKKEDEGKLEEPRKDSKVTRINKPIKPAPKK